MKHEAEFIKLNKVILIKAYVERLRERGTQEKVRHISKHGYEFFS